MDNGEWVYGDLRQINGECFVFPQSEGAACDRDKVIPDTVGQFTGLRDKNGKEIYEGDVVDFDNYLQGRSYVVFNSGCFRVKAPNYTTTLTYHVSLHTHIIGNIHDNPELMNH